MSRPKKKADPMPSKVLLSAHQQTGAGFHGKTRKAQRRTDKVALRKDQ